MPDYKAMQILVQVIESGSMHAAARKLNMTPSAVSQAVQKLETQLDVKLLIRTTRKLVLTEAGNAFYQHAKKMSEAAEAAVKAVELTRSAPTGELNITCISGLLDSLLLDVFKRVLHSHPELTLNINFDDKITDLIEDRVDIALRAGIGLLDDNMIARHLYDCDWVICAAPAYLSQHGTPTNLTQLKHARWINFRDSSEAKLRLSRGEACMELQPDYQVNCNHLLASRKLTRLGFGVSIQPRYEIQHYLDAGELVPLCPEWHLAPSPLYMIMLSRVQSEKVRIVSELIVEFFNELKHHSSI